MNKLSFVVVILSISVCAAMAEPAITVYNQSFAVVRETVPLDLKAGANQVQFSDVTGLLEPDSIVLRDAAGKRNIQVLEQSYRADPVTQERLLSLFEGKTIDFQVVRDGKTSIVQGKVIRSGYLPPMPSGDLQGVNFGYGSSYYQPQGQVPQPIIEVDGKLQFSLPGQPLFPALPDDTILKPTLNWTLQSDRAGPVNAELSYVTGGLSWEAAYNVVSPEVGDTLDLVGWITLKNQSGKEFRDAKVKLMAGSVNKIQQQPYDRFGQTWSTSWAAEVPPPVTEKAFDEYHLYTLARPTTIHDRETKQVEFARAEGVKSQRLYVYDGASTSWNQWADWDWTQVRQDRAYGNQSNKKVWVIREIVNSSANHLGIPLPKGRIRFYRQDTDGQLEFTGENTIDHTPKDETLRLYTGDSFDLVGERAQTDYQVDTARRTIDEQIQIKLRNHKKGPVEIRAVEHLYRALTWDIVEKTADFIKTDAHTVEFRVTVMPDEEKIVSYKVHYSW